MMLMKTDQPRTRVGRQFSTNPSCLLKGLGAPPSAVT